MKRLFGLAMSPRSSRQRPKTYHHLGEFQTHAFYVVPSMGPIVSVVNYMVGKTRSRKADQLVKLGNGTVNG